MINVCIIACDSGVSPTLIQRAASGLASYSLDIRSISVAGELSSNAMSELSSSWDKISISETSLSSFSVLIYVLTNENDKIVSPGEFAASNQASLLLAKHDRFHPTNRAGAELLSTKPNHYFFSVGFEEGRLPLDMERFHFFPYGYLFRDECIGPINDIGFRIPSDINSIKTRSSKTELLICIFGGSAAFSINCFPNEMFGQRIEHLLNQRLKATDSNIRYRVLNFAQHAHVVLNQLQTFLLFSETLKPDIIISHDGYNDLVYGSISDQFLLQEYSLTYHINMEQWANILHGNNSKKQISLSETIPIKNYPSDIVNSYLERKSQFQVHAKATGAEFISAFQPMLIHKPSFSTWEQENTLKRIQHHPMRETHFRMEYLYEYYLKERASYGFANDITFEETLAKNAEISFFTDFVHTTPAGDEQIAKAYADYIFRTRHLP